MLSNNDVETQPQPVRVSIHTKLTLPYILLALVLAVALILIINQLVLENVEERFTNQLIETGKLTTDLMVREEARRLETLRLVVNTAGIIENVNNRDAEQLREIILPIAVNTQEEAIEILDTNGHSILSLRHRPGGNLEEYLSTKDEDIFATWPIVQNVIEPNIEDGRDKYANIRQTEWGDYLYISGPIRDEDGQLVGVILIGKSLPTLVRQMRQDTFAQITFYTTAGDLIASTLPIDSPTTLIVEEAAIAQTTNQETAVLRDRTIGSINYTEILAIWQAQEPQPLSLIGVALPQTFLVQTSQTLQLRFALLVITAFSAIFAVSILLSNRITFPLLQLVKASTVVAQGGLDVNVTPVGEDEVAILTRSFNDMVANLREGAIYRDLLGRAITPAVRDELRRAIETGDVRLEGDVRTVTALYSDIRDFTTITEQVGPTQIFMLLNEYFGELISLISEQDGIITQMAGDSILAFFGLLPRALSPQESAYITCQVAIKMLDCVNHINAERKAQGKPRFVTGIGINTGDVKAGTVGNLERSHYMPVGDMVNTSQRLEAFTKRFGETSAVISQHTYEALGELRHHFNLEPLGPQLFKGKQEEILVYRLRTNNE